MVTTFSSVHSIRLPCVVGDHSRLVHHRGVTGKGDADSRHLLVGDRDRRTCDDEEEEEGRGHRESRRGLGSSHNRKEDG